MDSLLYIFCSAMEQVCCLTDLHNRFSDFVLMVKKCRQIRSCKSGKWFTAANKSRITIIIPAIFFFIFYPSLIVISSNLF